MKYSLPAFALKRPVTVTMLTASMVLLGVIAAYRIPLEFLPDVEPSFLGVIVPYPGATPAQVEQQIAIPVEGEFRTVPGLSSIRTISDSNGCFVSMLFNAETDMGLAAAEVRDRIERLKLVLPDDVDNIQIQRFSSQAIPVMAFGLFRPGGDAAFVELLRRVMEPRLRRLDGVADVELRSSSPEKEVVIEFEQDYLRNLNLGLFDLILTLRDSSLNVSVGELVDGDRKYIVRVVGEYNRLSELGELTVTPGGKRLKDIADIRYATRTDTLHVSLDGQGGALVLITKESEANTVSTCRLVREEMERIMALEDFEGVGKKTFFDQSEYITSALENLFKEGIYGGAMALIVLFVFLHRLLPTVVVALMIPTSLVVALVFMFFAGITLNMITMVSLIIVVGMLVDNAIVVVENIIRHRNLGESPVASARRGAQEVGLAILAATTTTWVVFVPMYYMDTGTMSVFMRQLGLPLIVALGGSLVLSLTVVPLVMTRLGARDPFDFMRVMHGEVRPRGRIFRVLRRLGSFHLVDRIIGAYGATLRLALSNRLAALLLLAALGAVTYLIPFKNVGMRGMPKLDTREVAINVRLDQSYDMERATRLFTAFEDQLNRRRDELGIKNIMTFFSANEGNMNLYLYTEEDGPIGKNPPYTTDEVREIVSVLLGKRMPGAEIQYVVTDTGNTGEGESVRMYVHGDDRERLEFYAQRFLERVERLPSVSDVKTDLENERNEIQIRIDGPLAEQYGVSAQAIALTADAAMRGARLPFMKQGNREIPVWAQFREEDRKSRSNLDKVSVLGASGELVPLNRLVDFSKMKTAASIHRFNGKNVIRITAQADSEDLGGIRRDLAEAINDYPLPPGYYIDFGDSLREVGENMANFTSTMIMALILIYLVMSALFESVFFPMSILTSVPLALGGAVWMLYGMGSQFDSVTLIGCILMAGVIVNNGIVIVDHINTVRKSERSLTDAIVRAGGDRFRPVMMTALTTILGLVPLAFMTTGSAATFAGLGQALIGGLTAGTVLTLVIVPVFYSIIDEFQGWFLRFIGGFKRRVAPAAEGAGEG
ncbi:MAG: efflux RND transporter permease subunit [Candidatus Hydrogenedentes bacterium]|nr:efflux RND transporter permease subunit [Candidatus Hydrogenedentota bacterium]